MTDTHDDDLFGAEPDIDLDDDEAFAFDVPTARPRSSKGASASRASEPKMSRRQQAAAIRAAIRKVDQIRSADQDLVAIAAAYAGVKPGSKEADRVLALLGASPTKLLWVADLQVGPHLSLELFAEGRTVLRQAWAVLRTLGHAHGELNASDPKAAMQVADAVGQLSETERHEIRSAARLCGKAKD